MAAKVVIKKEMGFFFYKAVFVADITYNKKYSSHSEVNALSVFSISNSVEELKDRLTEFEGN